MSKFILNCSSVDPDVIIKCYFYGKATFDDIVYSFVCLWRTYVRKKNLLLSYIVDTVREFTAVPEVQWSEIWTRYVGCVVFCGFSFYNLTQDKLFHVYMYVTTEFFYKTGQKVQGFWMLVTLLVFDLFAHSLSENGPGSCLNFRLKVCISEHWWFLQSFWAEFECVSRWS